MGAVAAIRPNPIALPTRSAWLILLSIGMLSSTMLLKIASVQYLEILELALLVYIVFRISRNGWHLHLSRAFLRIGAGYAVFFFVSAIGAALALQRSFYLDVQGLYGPGFITLARAAELIAGVSALLILADIFRRDRSKCIFTMKVYFLAGSLSSAVSLVALFVGIVLHIGVLGAAAGRASGFFNEGGPFGLYVLSVMSAGWVLRSFDGVIGKKVMAVAQVCNFLAFAASTSKAGLVALGLLFVAQLVISSGIRQRIFAGIVAAIAIAVTVTFTDVYGGTLKYIAGGEAYETYSILRPNDTNFVIGRAAGLYFVPRMIAAHPWLGVGWGNYGLVRNDVQYRGLSPVIGVTDSPGLGLYGTTAEVGIPLMILLLYLLLQPLLLTRRATHWRPLLTLALIQPVVQLCGAQLNLTYPWIVSAFALGLAGIPVPASPRRSKQPVPVTGRPALLAQLPGETSGTL